MDVLAMRDRYIAVPPEQFVSCYEMSEYRWFTDHGSVHKKQNFVHMSGEKEF